MKNYEKIKEMNCIELFRFIKKMQAVNYTTKKENKRCAFCKGDCNLQSCNDGLLNWLESEVEQ